MNKISLRLHPFWNHLYFQYFSFWDHRYPLPHGHLFKQDFYIKKIIQGLYPINHLEIHKTRGIYDIYLRFDHLTFPIYNSSLLHRLLFNILKTRIQIFHLYTFPLHDADLLIHHLFLSFLGSDSINSSSIQSQLRLFKRIWNMGLIKGIKIKIKGRYKKGASRSKSEVYQFGQIPNTPTTNLRLPLFYSSRLFYFPLGSSSLHLFLSF